MEEERLVAIVLAGILANPNTTTTPDDKTMSWQIERSIFYAKEVCYQLKKEREKAEKIYDHF